MKNRVSKAWGKDIAETYNTNPISDNDKALFRPQLIHALVVASAALRVQYTAILNKILATDYPNAWPEFYDLTFNLLQSDQVAQVYAGLTMLLELSKVYRWKSADHRAGLDAVVTNIFPVALQIAGKLLLDDNVAAGTMLVLILKSYKSAIAVGGSMVWLMVDGATPAVTGGSRAYSVGESLFTGHCERYSRESTSRGSRDQRGVSLDKNQEMGICESQPSFLQVISPHAQADVRYAVQTNMGDSKASAFGKHFIANFAPEIMKSYLHHIELYMAGKIWLSSRCVYHLVDFLEEWYVISQHN
jgi:importin-7